MGHDYDRRPRIARRLSALRLLVVSVAFVVSLALAGCDEEFAYDEPSQAQPSATVPVATAPPATPTSQRIDPAESPTAAPTQGASTGGPLRETVYTAQEGDTLGGIAVRFDTTVEALIEANDLASPDLIYVGQTLKIVAPGAAEDVAGAPVKPTATAQQDPAPPTQPAQPTEVVAAPTPVPPVGRPAPVVVNGRTYDAYNWAAIKHGQWYQYTCEFDAAWVVLKTYGYDVGLEEQVEIVGQDTSIEPYYEETEDGVVIYGGDVTVAYSGDYKKNFLARSSGQAMRKLFEHYGLRVTAVRDRASLEAALLRGEIVWIKTTVDFKAWVEATWVMPDGRSYQTVLGNDHALVVMGFNEEGVVVRDPLGPTSTNRQREYEYDVPWPKFMASWGAQEFDGLAVAPPD